MLFSFRSFRILFFAGAYLFCTQILPAQSLRDSDTGLQNDAPLPASHARAGSGTYAASTNDPIFLLNGSVTESVTDLSLPTPLSRSWSHRRTYDSTMTSGIAGKELLGSHGLCWLGGNQSEVLVKRGNNVSLAQSASNKRTFVEDDDGTYTPPVDFKATLVKSGTGENEILTLTYEETDEISIYYGFDGSIATERQGKLKERTNRQYRNQNLSGELYEYDEYGFVSTVTTAYPQEYCIVYTYEQGGAVDGRLTEIEVLTGTPDVTGTETIAKAEYLYKESLSTVHDDVGTEGDLVQVKVSVLASDRQTWQTRVTQYRYHDSEAVNAEGRSHQLKAVFEPDAVERIIAANSDISTPEDILTKSDSAQLAGGHSVAAFASRAFTYYTQNLDTDNPVSTVWGQENLAAKYGGTDQDELNPLKDGEGQPVAGHFVPRVKTETVNAACFSCGGGSTGGVAKSYHYMNLNEKPQSYTDGDPNAVTFLVVEDTVDSDGTPILRSVYGLDYRGKELRRIDIQDPLSPASETVCSSTINNAKGNPVEVRSELAHVAMTSDALIRSFLNPYDPTTQSWANDTATQSASAGIVACYQYDANGNRTGSLVKLGSGGAAYYVAAADYNANDQVTATYDYPEQTTDRGAASRVTTTYAYTYWDDAEKIVKTKTTTRQPVPLAQNGTGTSPVTVEYYDASGRLRWTRDALGVVAYYGYHPYAGTRTLMVRDVDTAALPAAITTSTAHIDAWTGTPPFPRQATLPAAFNQTTLTEYDDIGRLVKTVDPAGVPSYTVYEPARTLRFSVWDNALQRPTLPIEVTETDAAGNRTESYRVAPTAVVTASGKPTGIQPNAPKVAWTRFHYDPHGGTLQHIDRYHALPPAGPGTLNTHFYRTTLLHDRQGRQAATAAFVQPGRWQVEAKTHDWRNRTVETRRGVALNAPNFGDLESASWLAVTSQTHYEGPRIERQLSHYDTGASDYTGTAYVYDPWNRLRATYNYVPAATGSGTETPLSPFTVTDYNWSGKPVATARYETAPNWQTVATTTTYAETTATNRRALTKTNYDIHGNAYRQTVFEVSATGATGTSAATDTYRDATGRPIAREQTGGSRVETQYDAFSRAARTQTLAGTTVVAQAETVYDLRGNAVEQHTYELNAGETAGITPTSTNYTRRSVFAWHDNAGRLTTVADYGSGGPTWSYYPKPVRPQTAPVESSETVLLIKYAYNPTTGKADTVINPAGVVSKSFIDALERTLSTFKNYQTGTSTITDEDVETRYTYDGADNIVTFIAANPTTGDQVTKYLYEDPYNAYLETSAIYPDSSDTTSSGTDQVKKTYFFDNRPKTVADQNGTVRTFTYDAHRRMTSDSVTTLGNGVDGKTRKIAHTYDWSGATSSISSLDADDTVLNEIRYEYDRSRNLSKLYQSRSGSVNPNTTPCVTYQRADVTKSFRSTTTIYPSGKVLSYEYGASGSREDALNIFTSIKDGTQEVVNYLDMGFGTTAQVAYPEPNLTLTTTGAALDRFGRTVNHAWLQGADPLIHIIHRYDYAGNRTSRHDAVHAANSELYEYDQVNQIKSLNRGILDQNQSVVTNSTFTESWVFDKTGNWQEYDKNDITETRTHNKANEIQGIAAHDRNGNMTALPSPKGAGNLTCVYDAWNRLVEVRDTNDNFIARYEYNGANQRIRKTVDATVTTSFYNENWQELESQTNNELTTYVWGLRYIDDLIYREKGEERLYALQDPNWNVTAITDAMGEAKERYKYDAFGKSTVLDVDFAEKPVSTFLWNRTFTGQVYDLETGLMIYRNRHYRSNVGRFLNRDPIGYRGNDPNLYRYVLNAPLIYFDPLGLQRSSWINPYGLLSDSAHADGTRRNQMILDLANPNDFNSGYAGSVTGGAGGASSDTVAGLQITARLAVEANMAMWGMGVRMPPGSRPFSSPPSPRGIPRPPPGARNLHTPGPSNPHSSGPSSTPTPGTSPLNSSPKPCPPKPSALPDDIARTFQEGRYEMIVLDRDLIVYRGHGGDTGPVGRFTTPTYPLDRLDMRQSMAILEEWGNSLTEITTFRIPAGTTIYQGLAERQGNLPGWGLQTFIPDIRPEWIILTEPLQ